jgi:hypothetical protein
MKRRIAQCSLAVAFAIAAGGFLTSAPSQAETATTVAPGYCTHGTTGPNVLRGVTINRTYRPITLSDVTYIPGAAVFVSRRPASMVSGQADDDWCVNTSSTGFPEIHINYRLDNGQVAIFKASRRGGPSPVHPELTTPEGQLTMSCRVDGTVPSHHQNYRCFLGRTKSGGPEFGVQPQD